MIRILVADDHMVVREGLKRIIADTPDMTVAAEAENGRQVLDRLATLPIDLLLLDVSMPDTNALELLKEIRARLPRLPVLVLSMLPEDQYAVRMLKAGASGYLTKASAADLLVHALRKVARGGKYISLELAEKLAFDLDSSGDRPPHELLSDREYQVLLLIAAGKQVKEIAHEMGLSVKTISTYRTRILDKMGMKTNAELTHYAIRGGLVK